MTYMALVGAKGQVIIPASIRKNLSIIPNKTMVSVSQNSDGSILFHPATRDFFMKFYGISKGIKGEFQKLRKQEKAHERKLAKHRL